MCLKTHLFSNLLKESINRTEKIGFENLQNPGTLESETEVQFVANQKLVIYSGIEGKRKKKLGRKIDSTQSISRSDLLLEKLAERAFGANLQTKLLYISHVVSYFYKKMRFIWTCCNFLKYPIFESVVLYFPRQNYYKIKISMHLIKMLINIKVRKSHIFAENILFWYKIDQKTDEIVGCHGRFLEH